MTQNRPESDAKVTRTYLPWWAADDGQPPMSRQESDPNATYYHVNADWHPLFGCPEIDADTGEEVF